MIGSVEKCDYKISFVGEYVYLSYLICNIYSNSLTHIIYLSYFFHFVHRHIDDVGRGLLQ